MRSFQLTRRLALKTTFAIASALPLAVGAHAEALEQGDQGDAVQEEEIAPEIDEKLAQDAKTLKRILHLQGGGKLRGIARFNLETGAWELRGKKRKFEPLEVGAVTHTVLEKDILREAKKRLRGVDADHLDARSLHASWLMEQGLTRESLELYEILLRKDPDHAPTRRFVLEGPRPSQLVRIALQEDPLEKRKALLDYGSRPSALSREHTLRELSYLEDAPALHHELNLRLGSENKHERSFATLALRRLYKGESARELLVHSVLDRDEDVRRGAAYALRDAQEPALIVPLLRALESANVKVRTNATESLGNMGAMGAANALEPLITHYSNLATVQTGGIAAVPRSHIFVGRQFAYIQDFDVEVAQFQAVADPQINVLVEGSVLQARVIGVRDPLHLYERRVVRDALRKLSGADPGDRPSAWVNWLEKTKAERTPVKDGRTSADAKN